MGNVLTINTPMALVIAAVAIAAVIAVHLLSVQQPRVLAFPTARFVRDSTAHAVTRANRPRDLWLLLVRVLAISALGTAFAGVSCAALRPSAAAIVVVDGADVPGFLERARDAVRRDSTLRVLPVRRLVVAGGRAPSSHANANPVVSVLPMAAPLATALDTMPPAVGESPGLAALLLAARRSSVTMAEEADSVVLVVLSPLLEDALSDAIPAVRHVWPGTMHVPDVQSGWSDSADAGTYPTATIVWPDSATRRGGTVRMPGALPVGSQGAVRAIVAQGTAVVGPFVAADVGGVDANGAQRSDINGSAGETPVVLAWWHDGSPAIVERATATGCERRVGFFPPMGDVLQSDAARGVRRVLSAPCTVTGTRRAARAGFTPRSPAYSDSLRTLLRQGDRASVRATPREQLAKEGHSGAPLTPWLLLAAVLLLGAEWVLRRRSPSEPVAP